MDLTSWSWAVRCCSSPEHQEAGSGTTSEHALRLATTIHTPRTLRDIKQMQDHRVNYFHMDQRVRRQRSLAQETEAATYEVSVAEIERRGDGSRQPLVAETMRDGWVSGLIGFV